MEVHPEALPPCMRLHRVDLRDVMVVPSHSFFHRFNKSTINSPGSALNCRLPHALRFAGGHLLLFVSKMRVNRPSGHQARTPALQSTQCGACVGHVRGASPERSAGDRAMRLGRPAHFSATFSERAANLHASTRCPSHIRVRRIGEGFRTAEYFANNSALLFPSALRLRPARGARVIITPSSNLKSKLANRKS
jgi:hypothetical protein